MMIWYGQYVGYIYILYIYDIYIWHIGCNHHHIKISICLMVWASSIHFHQKNKSLSDCDENQHQLKHSVLMCACQEETTTKTNIIYIYCIYIWMNLWNLRSKLSNIFFILVFTFYEFGGFSTTISWHLSWRHVGGVRSSLGEAMEAMDHLVRWWSLIYTVVN